MTADRRRTPRGFSLIEMIVALSLSIIVIALATSVLAVAVADGRREAVRAELAREAAFAQTVLTQTLGASGVGVPRGELITNPGERVYGGVLIAQADATGIVGDLPRPGTNFNSVGPIAGRPAFTDQALAWTTANSGSCMPGPGCPSTGSQSVLFPGDSTTCTSDETDRTCPWGLNRVMADDWLLIAAGDGSWTWGRAASPLSMSEAYGVNNGWFLDLDASYNGGTSVWPYDLAGPPLSTRGLGMVSTPDRVFFRLSGTELQRKQCWGKPLPNDSDWPPGNQNDLASINPQDVGTGSDTDCFPSGAGWETLLTNVGALTFRYFQQDGSEILPASVTSTGAKESITRVEWTVTVERTVIGRRVYHEPWGLLMFAIEKLGKRMKATPLARRGFVLLIVLMVLVALSTAVILSFESAAFESVASSREREQSIAKSLAEACLDRAMKHARSVIAGAGTPDPDLDRILDPNLDTDSTNDFIPTSNDGVVYVPNNGTDSLRRFAVLRDQGGTHPELVGGGCLVRFDDNMDDQLPGLTLTTASNIPEGPGAGQVLNRDRDGVVTVTSIGLYPVFANTLDAEIYERAHGRSTLKGLVNVEVSYASAVPTVHVWDNVSIANGASHNAVCGAGGALYDDIYGMTPSQTDRFGVCGEVDDDGAAPFTTPGVPDSHMCPSSLVGSTACEPQALSSNTNSNPTMTVNSANTPTRRTSAGAPTWPYYEGLGKASGADYKNDDPFDVGLGSYPGGGDACAFYYTEPGYRGGIGYAGATAARVFVWDRTATDAAASLTLAANNVNSVSGPATTLNENCQSTIAKRQPCSWQWDAGNNRWDVQCNVGESPCWKLVADLDGTDDGYLQNEDADTGPKESTILVSGVETFQPVADRDIPFIDNIAAGSWNALCQLGGPAGTQTGTPGDRGFGYNSGHFELMQDLLENTWPGNKAIHIFDNGPTVGSMVRLPKKFGDEGDPPIQHSIITRGSIEFTEMVYACCPRCDCSTFNPSTWDDLSASTGPELEDTGYFLFSGRYAFFNTDKIKGLRGDLYAKNIHIDKKAFINGDLFGWGTCIVLAGYSVADCGLELIPIGSYGGMETCDSPTPGTDGVLETLADGVSICMRDENVIVGAVVGYGDVSIHNKNTLINRESYASETGPPVIMDWGAVIGWDVWMKEDNDVLGRIITRDDFAMKKHNRIFWPGASLVSTTPTITNVELRVSEQSW